MAEDQRYRDYFNTAVAQSGLTGPALRAYVAQLLAQVEATLRAGDHSGDVVEAEMRQARAAAEEVTPVSTAPAMTKTVVAGPKRTMLGGPPSRSLYAAFAVLLLAAYALLAWQFFRSGDDEFMPAHASEQELLVEMRISAMDFVRETATLTLTPTGGKIMDAHGRLSRDVALTLDAGAGPSTTMLKAGAVIAPWAITISADSGDILNYPFDKYLLEFEISAKAGGDPISVEAAFEGTPHGLTAAVTETTQSDDAASVSIVVRRGGGILFVVILSTLSLLLVCAAACAVAWQVAWYERKVEFSMMVWVAALLFVIPTVRNGLPGSVPPGAAIDFLVFFWLQIATVTAMTTLVATWVRRRA